ncbi:oxygenase MpaB family protein [Bradyrhizobium guangzhouense]|uniref:oxygenase MpaB family protein n=1 Tax=Bradyrhizobium guangzhouense TaxID=1325095 RepID=UPI0013E89907|nr:oxygenase MpaB family protein [Bradyrhizobium guangzhouense]
MVSEDDLESALDKVRAEAAGPIAGVFGPGSMTWRIDREAAVFLGAGRALLLQLAHPWVAAAIAEHSTTFADPIGRFHRTFDIVFAMVFGSLDRALLASRQLHRRHTMIVGEMPEAVGPFAAGSRYCANDIPSLRWVHATLVESALMAHDQVLPKLAAEERELYWTESRTFGALFGLTGDDLPADWSAFAAYTASMAQSETLTVSDAAREIATQIFAGARPWLRPPRWYRALTAKMLPERLREGFGLALDARDMKAADDALSWIRRIYPKLPDRLRYASPYQEAQARLRGELQPDWMIRGLNRLWIGRPQMDVRGKG